MRGATKIPQRQLTRAIKAMKAAGISLGRIEVYGPEKVALIPATVLEHGFQSSDTNDEGARPVKKNEWD